MQENAPHIPKSEDLPKLEDRFTKPEGWRWHYFTRKGRKIRFGCVFPQGRIPDAIVVCLPGLSEYGEKYFETARWCLSKNMAFWVIDWAGQGRSSRYFPANPQKRHALDFQNDVDDLHYFFKEYIKHASGHPDKGRIPAAMLCHSMGGNIGLRYLQQHPETFECAAFSAPLCGLHVFKYIPRFIHLTITSFANEFFGKNYAPGEGDWTVENRSAEKTSALFSSDSIRGSIHNYWCIKKPELRSGFVTFGWIHRAATSCAFITRKSFLRSIRTHCLIAMAGHEYFVDNRSIRRASKMLPYAKLIEYPDSRHEILMETDKIRGDFLNHFYKLVKENIIDRPETLKPF